MRGAMREGSASEIKVLHGQGSRRDGIIDALNNKHRRSKGMGPLPVVSDGPIVRQRELQPAVVLEHGVARERTDGGEAGLETRIIENTETLQRYVGKVILNLDLPWVEEGKRLEEWEYVRCLTARFTVPWTEPESEMEMDGVQQHA